MASMNGSEADMTPLNIVIVGAGIGGLTAALVLRQQGHHVILLESSGFSNEIGAAIHISPYCHGLLRRLGIFAETFGANECTGCTIYAAAGHKITFINYKAESHRWQHSRLLVHRAHLHSALRENVVSEKGQGRPCILRLSSKVVSVDPDEAEVVLENGERVSGDLILGADGVHSLCRKALEQGKGYVPFDSGIHAFRLLIPVKSLREDPTTKDIVGDEGNLTVVMGSGSKRLVCYPMINNTMMNCVFLHPSSESQSDLQEWSQRGDKKLMLQIAKDFAPPFRAVLEKASEETLKVWTLLDLPALPTWINGKMALLGDAAHPFLPHRGEGGAQAIEDAMSLGALLPLGTPINEIPERLEIYEKCRKDRATRIQQASRLNSLPPDVQRKKGFFPHVFDNYSLSHDEWHHSKNALQRSRWTKEAYRWRQPLSFGPSPGPSQPHNELPAILSDSKQWQIMHSIRFATSKTYLQNLLPTQSFSFATSDTVVQASFVCCSLRDMVWLGGAGYNHCGLYIHGIQYTKRNGEVISGTFLPILFENLTDPIVTGREELGAPVWGCDIDISDSENSKAIKLSWRGTTFGELNFKELSNNHSRTEGPGSGGKVPKHDIPPKPSPDSGLLMYRYIPAVGQPDKADAEYGVFDPYGPPIKPGTEISSTKPVANGAPDRIESGTGSKMHVDEASFKFTANDWRSLPTIHHIAKALEEIPVYQILEAKVETIHSVHARYPCRIE